MQVTSARRIKTGPERRDLLPCRDCGASRPSAGPDARGRCLECWSRAAKYLMWNGLQVNCFAHQAHRRQCSRRWSTADYDD